jgi:hypothetical protein
MEASSNKAIESREERISEKQTRLVAGLGQAVLTLQQINAVLQNMDQQTGPSSNNDNPNNLNHKLDVLKEELRQWKNV